MQNINNIDNWFHISFQIDQTIENKIKIYINGQLENYSNINNILTIIQSGILELPVEYNNVNQIINLAELKIFKKTFTQEEIYSTYKNEMKFPWKNNPYLVGYWPLSNYLIDYSKNNIGFSSSNYNSFVNR